MAPDTVPVPGISQAATARLAEPWRRLRRLPDRLADPRGRHEPVLDPGAGELLPEDVRLRQQYPDPTSPGYNAASQAYFPSLFGTFILIGIAAVVIEVAYYWLLTCLWGTTVGKRAVGIWVISTSDGTKPSAGPAFVRALVFIVAPAVVGFFFLLDNLWLLWDNQRQCLHDKAASTIVVKGEAIGR